MVENIRRAEKVAIKYWKKGYAVICPHSNTALFDGSSPDEVWLNGDLELIKRSDTVVMIKGWEKSIGASNEYSYAKKLKKKIIFNELA